MVKIEYDELKDKFYVSLNGELNKTFFGEYAIQEYLRELNFPHDRVQQIIDQAIIKGYSLI